MRPDPPPALAADPMNLQPHLSDGHVALRPLAADDWAALFAVASDPLIWAGHPAHDRWREPVFRAFFADALASSGALIITNAVDGVVIGASRYDRNRAGPGEIVIGPTFLARDRWGGATNARIKRLMIGHALGSFDRVIFLVGENNIRSRRAMAKIGGVLTDRIDEAEMAGQRVRHMVYAIDRAGFAAGPLAEASRNSGDDVSTNNYDEQRPSPSGPTATMPLPAR